MTRDEEAASIEVIAFCRLYNGKMAAKQAGFGARRDDIAIAAAYSAVDLAQHHTGGDPASAIAWLRRALDVMEEGAPVTAETLQ